MTIEAKQTLWQNDLIDMSRRNRLLYFSTGARITDVEFLLSAPDSLHTFLTKLQNPLVVRSEDTTEPDLCDVRLEKLRRKAREALNDRGVQILYLAFGLLEWRESTTSDELIHSPLGLLPVALGRDGMLGKFRLARIADEELEMNPVLLEKLHHDFDITLLPFSKPGFGPAEIAPASPVPTSDRARLVQILDAMRATIESKRPLTDGWRLIDEVHLSTFSFQKLVMYQDLQRQANSIRQHDILRALGGEPRVPSSTYDGIAAHELDARVSPKDTLEVLEADSSQQEAIVAAKKRANFVLQGPPGTGKSQTIANIIAESLGLGRSVLFVSEKMAALDVVQERLKEAGLSEYCLELHAHSADKKAFLRDLQAALDDAETVERRTNGYNDWLPQSTQLEQVRERLNDYVRALHKKHQPLNKSAFDAYAELARLRETPDLDFSLSNIATLDQITFERMKESLEQLLRYRDVLEQLDSYPWHETLVTNYTLQLEGDISTHFGQLREVLEQLDTIAAQMRTLLDEPGVATTFRWLSAAVARTRHLAQTPQPPQSWLRDDGLRAVRERVSSLAQKGLRYQTVCAELDTRYSRHVLALDHPALLHALSDQASWAMSCLRVTTSARTAHDEAIINRTHLDQQIRSCLDTVKRMREDASVLAATLCQPEPATTDEVAQLLALACLLAESPQSPKEWLATDRLGVVQAVAEEAERQYRQSKQRRAELESRFESSFFDLDIAALCAHQRDQWAPLWRYLHPSYYAELKQVRACLKSGQTRSGAQVKADLFSAEKLLAEETWLVEHRGELAQTLGRHFHGEETDWGHVTAMLDWTARLLAYYPYGLPDEIATLVSGHLRSLEPMRTQYALLAEAWDTWQKMQVALGNLFAIPVFRTEGQRWSGNADPTRVRALQSQAVLPQHVQLSGQREEYDLEHLCDTLVRLHTDLTAYWQATDLLDTELRQPPAVREYLGYQEICHDLEQAQEAAALAEMLQAREATLMAALEHLYRGLETDWKGVLAAFEWCETLLHSYPGRMVPDGVRLLASNEGNVDDRASLTHLASVVEQHQVAVQSELSFAESVLPRSRLLAPAETLEEAQVRDVRETVHFHLDHLGSLERWLGCVRQRAYCADIGLSGLLDTVRRFAVFPPMIVDCFEKRVYQLWLDDIIRRSPDLEAFQGESHQTIIERFRALDTEHTSLARQVLREKLHDQRYRIITTAQSSTPSRARAAGSQDVLATALASLRRELAKKRNKSIRSIVRACAPAIVALKPCWMMSPLSVSQYIDSGDKLFDLVIFDEASQVCPEDAIGTILRGSQLIVVGDSKQLPPTNFFRKTLADDSDEDEDEESDDAQKQAEAERTESILDACTAVFPRRELLWHYRSQHESLIAFSNAHFYNGRLLTFPAPRAQHRDGVRYDYIKNGRYERGGQRCNMPEAEHVVDLIGEYAKEHGTIASLGVIALSEAQQSAIREVIQQRIRTDPLLRAYENELDEPDGGFFIKNLESVQGDERDDIILSIGYGPDSTGKISFNFGPINKPGGERRLNVAVTRARKGLILVTSLRSHDLPKTLSSSGAQALRDYIEFAEQGPAVLPSQVRATSLRAIDNDLHFDSPLEEAVYQALQAKGLHLATQVGCSGYRIDLAVRDPHNSAHYLLGIECDGATYHSSATARDRDRLRQRQLEAMGWHILRIWSRDWVRNPQYQVERVLDALHGLEESGSSEETGAEVS